MRRTIALLVVLLDAGGALAEPPKLAMTDAGATAPEQHAKRDQDCKPDAGVRMVETGKTTLGKVLVTALHYCEDGLGFVTITTGTNGEDMYFGEVGTVRSASVKLLRDRFTTGTFADRTPAVVYRADLREGKDSRQLVIACTLPTAAKPVPRCTEVAHAACATEACAAPVLERGVLTAGEGRARQKFVVAP